MSVDNGFCSRSQCTLHTYNEECYHFLSDRDFNSPVSRILTISSDRAALTHPGKNYRTCRVILQAPLNNLFPLATMEFTKIHSTPWQPTLNLSLNPLTGYVQQNSLWHNGQQVATQNLWLQPPLLRWHSQVALPHTGIQDFRQII